MPVSPLTWGTSLGWGRHGLRETQHITDSIDRSIGWYEKHFPPASAAVYTNLQP